MNFKAVAILLGIAGAFANPAQASDASTGVALRAVVEPFCRIKGEESAYDVNGGVVELGVVREVCNTRGGYRVHARFLNVRQGVLTHGDESSFIDSQGLAVFDSGIARARSAAWRISDAERIDELRPVFMRLTISPI